MKRITIQLSMASLLFSLASCGANMKQEHPQAYDSYKSRRMPKENVMAASGDYLKEQEAEKKIVAYKGGLFNQRNAKMEDKKEYPTSNEEPFMKRLLARMGFNTDSSSTQAANSSSSTFNTRIPVQQPSKAYNTPLPQVRQQQETYIYQHPASSSSNTSIPMSSDSSTGYLQRPDANMPQGSAYTYTYYDIADEVIPSSPVHNIEMSALPAPIQLAAAGHRAGEPMIPPSAPQVDVPPTPTVDDMRNSAMSSPLQPELRGDNEGPRIPRPPVGSPKPKPHGFAPRHKGPYPEDYSEPYDKGNDDAGESSASSNNNRNIVVNDPSARVYYKNGKPVVTGTMGN